MLRWLKRIFIVLCVFSVIGVVGGIVFVIITNHIVNYAANFWSSELDDMPSADAIMVLGALVNDGRPSPTLALRLDRAIELYNAGKAPKIIVSGDHGQKEYNEVCAMKFYLLERGVPRDDIFLDHAGFNTYDSMYRAKAIFGVNTLIITTQQFHISRSVYIARKLGIEAYGYPCTMFLNYYNRQYGDRESLAKIKAFIDVHILQRGPRFLGEPISLEGSGLVTDGCTCEGGYWQFNEETPKT